MTVIKNVLAVDGSRQDYTIDDGATDIINGDKLLALPGLIDPHVHFRVPGMEHKEDWITGSKAAFKGGYTTVFDMPNTKPATNTLERLEAKITLIDSQIQQSGFPLEYKLFFGADKHNFHQIHKIKDIDKVSGIKVFMGASTGDLLLDDESSLHAIYAIAKRFNLIIALHAEDEVIIKENTLKYQAETDFKYHSIIRSIDAAKKAVELVVELSRIYDVTSYVLHVSTKEEIEIIRNAKAHGIKIFAETCPHYLFLDDSMYDDLRGRVKMNPPVRSKAESDYLWQAIRDGIIDTIASDHAPHTLEEKEAPLCKCPSGIPGIETTLPLLLTVYKAGKIELNTILNLTHNNPKKIFKIKDNNHMVFVNMSDFHELTDTELFTKVKWSPYRGMKLTGFIEYVCVNNKLYSFI